MSIRFTAGLIMSFLIATQNICAESVRIHKNDTNIILENQFLKVEISALGGRVTSLYDKKAGVDYAKSTKLGKSSGFCKDRQWEYNTVNEIRFGIHVLSVVKKSNDLVTVKTSFTGKRKTTVKGFEFVKKYTLKRDECRLLVEYRIKSHSVEGEFSPWLHNMFVLPANFAAKKEAYIFAQLERGLYCQQVIKPKRVNNLLVDLKEPWIGVVSSVSQEGIVEVAKHGAISHFYCWLGNDRCFSMEAVFNKTKIGLDGSWMSHLAFMPVKGIKGCHFATEEYAGCFSSDNNIKSLNIFTSVGMGETTISVYLKTKKLGSWKFNSKAGEAYSFPLKINDAITEYKVIVSVKGEKSEHDIFASPVIKQTAVKVAHSIYGSSQKTDSASVKNCKKAFFISPDMPTVIAFSMRSEFKKRYKDVELVLEVPIGVDIIDGNDGGPVNKPTIEKILIDGRKYTRFAFKGKARTYWAWFKVLTSTKWKPGKKGVAYYYVRWKGGAQKKVRVPIKSVHIPSAPLPKRLITSQNWYGTGLIYKWPNFIDCLKRLGLNTVVLSEMRKERGLKLFKRATADAKKAGMFVACNHSVFHRFIKEAIADGGQIEIIDGVKNHEACPSYRGKAFQEEIDNFAVYGKYGVSMLYDDTELWTKSDYCYCTRCLDRFKKYLAKRNSGIKYLSPKIFELNPDKYPKLHKTWREFKISLGTEMFKACADAFRKNVKQSGKMSSPSIMLGIYNVQPGSVYHQFLSFEDLYEKGVVDICQPSLYVGGDALAVAESVKNARSCMGNSRIIPWLSAGYNTPSTACDPVDVKYMVLENFLNGAMGFTTFTWYGFSGMDMRYLSEAMNMVVPVEDIIVDGKIIRDLNSSNPQVKLCGLRRGDEQLILVSEYSMTVPTSTTFTVNVDKPCDVVDMETKKIIKTIKSAGAHKISVTLRKSRAALIHIGQKK